MAYTAPAYNNVNFNFSESGYTAPSIDNITFSFTDVSINYINIDIS